MTLERRARRARLTTTRRSSTSAICPGSPRAATTGPPSTSSCARSAHDRIRSEVWEGEATLELFEAPNEEHTALAPVRVGKGFRFTLGYSVDDLETLVEL